MALKMKELMRRSGESKSTILYYVKEGLLPQPQKPKPNVHLYDEQAVEILRLIKYLQHNFNYSIAEIKTIFAQNDFGKAENFEMMVTALQMLSGGREERRYNREDLLEMTQVEESKLDRFIEKGLLFERSGGFSAKEVEIVSILKRVEEMGLDSSLLDAYTGAAKRLAKEEFEAGAKLMKKDPDRRTEHYELFFDLILTLKPYLCNMHTVKEYQRQYQNEKEQA